MSAYVANLEIYPQKLGFIRDRVLIIRSSFDCFIPWRWDHGCASDVEVERRIPWYRQL